MKSLSSYMTLDEARRELRDSAGGEGRPRYKLLEDAGDASTPPFRREALIVRDYEFAGKTWSLTLLFFNNQLQGAELRPQAVLNEPDRYVAAARRGAHQTEAGREYVDVRRTGAFGSVLIEDERVVDEQRDWLSRYS